jgi:hypothetical protein
MSRTWFLVFLWVIDLGSDRYRWLIDEDLHAVVDLVRVRRVTIGVTCDDDHW